MSKPFEQPWALKRLEVAALRNMRRTDPTFDGSIAHAPRRRRA